MLSIIFIEAFEPEFCLRKLLRKVNMLKPLKEKTSQCVALVKIDAQRGFGLAPPSLNFYFFFQIFQHLTFLVTLLKQNSGYEYPKKGF
jgi:hypothetical protein